MTAIFIAASLALGLLFRVFLIFAEAGVGFAEHTGEAPRGATPIAIETPA